MVPHDIPDEMLHNVLINVCVHVSTSSLFVSHITADRGKIATHFLCLHHLGGPHYRMMCIFKYEKMLRIGVLVCVSVVLWCNGLTKPPWYIVICKLLLSLLYDISLFLTNYK